MLPYKTLKLHHIKRIPVYKYTIIAIQCSLSVKRIESVSSTSTSIDHRLKFLIQNTS